MRSRSSGTEAPPLLAAFIILAALLANSCDAFAQEPELPPVTGQCAPEVSDLRRAGVEHEGQSGIWFHIDVARCMAGRLGALPLYAERVRLLDQQLQLTGERDALRVRQVALAEEGEERAVEALTAAVRRAREAEEDRDAWYRHPAFWAVLGAVIVVGLEALAIWALSEVTP